MKRRNFVLGIGAIATISGGAALTAAALADSVTPSADFRVTVERELTVLRGDHTQGEGNFAAESLDFTSDEAPAAWVNDEEDDDLVIEVVVENEEGETDFDELIKVRNDGQVSESVGIEWGAFGDDVGTEANDVSEETVVDIYTFEVDGAEVSPASEDGDPENFFTVEPGEEVNIDLTVDLTGATDEIGQAASPSGNPWEGAEDDVDLLDTINVGVEN